MSKLQLQIDPDRDAHVGYRFTAGLTGIFVRAQDPRGRWVNADIAVLDHDSLMAWLRSRLDEGEKGNPWAESVVETLLGHR